jgi:hypothetical protein
MQPDEPANDGQYREPPDADCPHGDDGPWNDQPF